MEKQPDRNLESEKEASFENLFQKMVSDQDTFIDYNLSYPKSEFLDFLSNKGRFLFHGSSNIGTHKLEPRTTNCLSKKFGNLTGVYATQDSILPIFYAIRDDKKGRGRIVSGYYQDIDPKTGKINKIYDFQADESILKAQPWSDGMVCILPKETFEQGTDDAGKLIDEFISRTPVMPIARLKVMPGDFPYLNDIKIYEK